MTRNETVPWRVSWGRKINENDDVDVQRTIYTYKVTGSAIRSTYPQGQMLSISENKMRGMRMRVEFVIVVVALILTSLSCAAGGVLCREAEKEALLDLKLSFTSDPYHVLSSWITSNPECCEWGAVICDKDNGHVVGLYVGPHLESHQLRPSLLELHHLKTLDLSSNNFRMRIPEFIGSLTNLTYLHLSDSGFYGKIPPHLGNLTSLQTLLLDGSLSGLLYSDNLQWLSHLSSLQFLDLSYANLSNAVDWVSSLKRLSSLSHFGCSSCSLPTIPPPESSMCLLNHFTSLSYLDLSYCHLSSSTFLCLINGTTNLILLSLASVSPEQNPDEFFRPLLESAARLMWLEELDISRNRLSEFMLAQDSSSMPKLETLDISYNLMTTVPDLSTFSSLLHLDASFNRISGTLYENLKHLPTNLASLDLSANTLNDVVSNVHFSNFSYLTDLTLSENYLLTLNFTKSWMPPFQLQNLDLSSCKIGPRFPNWLLKLKNLQRLDISNSSIIGHVPNAFWNYSTVLSSLNISNNKLQGTLPNLSFVFTNIEFRDLSSNEFHGPIPLFILLAPKLDLSNNKFSSFPPIQHEASNISSWQINLSNNRLSGSLPGWIFQISGLRIINLAYNMFSGAIPSNIGSSGNLNALHLNNNRLSGNLPSSFKSCTQLVILELGNNNFSGSVPLWLGDSMSSLIVLNLRSNNFTGNLPPNLCHLQRLQVLDLSSNKISGSIPRCVNNFTSMATYDTLSIYDLHSSFLVGDARAEFIDYATIMWKGILANESGGILRQLNVIDLSDNCLTGEIPSGFTCLKYLRSLDLSRNKLNGSIPYEIGQLKVLEVLKLSSNRLGGEIPQSLADLTFLNTLNLSRNNLAGRIPKSTQLQSFDRSSYGGNPELCGDPLPTICPGDIIQQPATVVIDHDQTGEKDDETFDMQAFYAALGSGFAFGLLGILEILNFHARSRHAFFHFAGEVGDWISVRIFLYQSGNKRRLCF